MFALTTNVSDKSLIILDLADRDPVGNMGVRGGVEEERGENASALIPTICGTFFVDFCIVAVAIFKIKYINPFAKGVTALHSSGCLLIQLF
jgi:hypothetical protein